MLPKPDQIKSVLMLAGVGAAVYVAYKVKQGASAAIDTAELIVTEKINPASRENIIYKNFTPDSVKNGLLDPVFKGLENIGIL